MNGTAKEVSSQKDLGFLSAIIAIIAVIAIADLLTGCVAIKVEDYGQEVVRDAAGNPVVDTNGVVQTVHKGQRWHYNKNMVEQSAEEIDFTRKPGDDIHFLVKNYRDVVSAELNKVIDTSFKGAAELAAKIGAAIATSGGSVAGEAGTSALKNAISSYLAKGGNPDNTTVTCKDGSCTFTDGTVTETCADCVDCSFSQEAK